MASNKKEAPKTNRSITITSADPKSPTLIELKWYFTDPHAAGHVVGQLIKTLIRAFEESNPGRSRHEILTELLEGTSCRISDGFIDGEDNDVIQTH